MKKLFMAVALMMFSVGTVASDRVDSVTVKIGQGEFENSDRTHMVEGTIRKSFIDDVVYGVIEHRYIKDHPVISSEKDQTMVGVGYRVGDIHLESVVNEEHFKVSAMYEHRDVNDFVYSGGIWHGDMWDENFSQTFVEIGFGKQFDAVYVGGFYEVGNTTKRSVDDLYGVTVRYSW